MSPLRISHFVKSCRVAGGNSVLATAAWPLRSSLLMTLKAVFPHEKRNKCKPHDWGSRDIRQGNRAPPIAVCRSLLLFSPASSLGLLGWSLDRVWVRMLPALFLHPVCFSMTRSAAAIPSSPKAFPIQRVNRRDLSGFERVLEWGGFLCLLSAGTSPHYHLNLSR